MEFRRTALLSILAISPLAASDASSPLIVFDDADENGFDHNSSYTKNQSQDFFVDDVVLIAADIFKNGFE